MNLKKNVPEVVSLNYHVVSKITSSDPDWMLHLLFIMCYWEGNTEDVAEWYLFSETGSMIALHMSKYRFEVFRVEADYNFHILS